MEELSCFRKNGIWKLRIKQECKAGQVSFLMLKHAEYKCSHQSPPEAAVERSGRDGAGTGRTAHIEIVGIASHGSQYYSCQNPSVGRKESPHSCVLFHNNRILYYKDKTPVRIKRMMQIT
jgi:hypothetical protein